MTSKGDGLGAAAEKGYLEQNEDVEDGTPRKQGQAKHGDRALAIIGDERVSLTDDDVCIICAAGIISHSH